MVRRTAADKVLHVKAFTIAKNPKYDRYQRGLASMIYKFFDKKSPAGAVKNWIIPNQELAEELHKPIIRKSGKQKVYSSFKDNVIWGADLVDMQLISKFNKEVRFLLCIIKIYSKYTWLVPLIDEKGITITNALYFKNFKWV